MKTTKQVTITICDICGKAARLRCSFCKRDICSSTKKNNPHSYTCFDYDPDYHGDYPDKLCNTCLTVYVPARKELYERHEREEEEMENKVREEILKNYKEIL